VTAAAVLAVDQGTSGTKAVVVDPVDGVVAAAEVNLHPHYLPDGGVEQDPQQLLDSVLDAGRQALRQAARPVSTVALANQGETVLAWDRRSGRPLSPAIVWQDRRSAEICARLRDHSELIAARTGLVLDPYFSAPKMAWIRRTLTTDGVVTTTDSWLVHQLTGEFVTDPTTASRSLLLDIDRVDWDAELLQLFGLGGEPMPRIAECDEPVGRTTAFGAPMTLGGLVVDQQAALLAQRCREPGAAKCTFGTGAFLLANTGNHAVRSTAGLTSSVAWRTRDQPAAYCVDGQVYTAASAVRWLTQLGLLRSARELDTAAGDSSQGVFCVPALAGLAAPWWRPDATASFTGMTLATRPEHLVSAVLEGIAAQVAELTDVITSDLGRPLQSLRVDGGLTRSRALMRAVANLTQLPVELYPSAHATALGAAALARMAGDPALDLPDAILDWTPADRYEPGWTTEQSGEFRDRWRAVASASLPPTSPPKSPPTSPPKDGR
jgi:glycerol kinase